MDYNKERTSSNSKVRNERSAGQQNNVQSNQPGRGNKKLEGPNRPST